MPQALASVLHPASQQLRAREAGSRVPIVAPRIELAWGLGERDTSILAAMLAKLEGFDPDFEQAAAALHEAVIELIPAGRTYVIGATARGPILGSLITGVGIAPGVDGIIAVRVDRGGRARALGSLWR